MADRTCPAPTAGSPLPGSSPCSSSICSTAPVCFKRVSTCEWSLHSRLSGLRVLRFRKLGHTYHRDFCHLVSLCSILPRCVRMAPNGSRCFSRLSGSGWRWMPQPVPCPREECAGFCTAAGGGGIDTFHEVPCPHGGTPGSQGYSVFPEDSGKCFFLWPALLKCYKKNVGL